MFYLFKNKARLILFSDFKLEKSTIKGIKA